MGKWKREVGNTSENAFLEPWNHGNPPTITSHEQVTALGFGWITGKVLTGDPAFGGPETYKASHDGPRSPCRASAWFSISKIISDQMDRSQPWVALFLVNAGNIENVGQFGNVGFFCHFGNPGPWVNVAFVAAEQFYVCGGKVGAAGMGEVGAGGVH